MLVKGDSGGRQEYNILLHLRMKNTDVPINDWKSVNGELFPWNFQMSINFVKQVGHLYPKHKMNKQQLYFEVISCLEFVFVWQFFEQIIYKLG